MASFIIIIFIIVFSLLPLSSPIPDETLLNAADILSNSGYISMSLTLGLVAKTLISASPSATIFSPSDDAFSLYGQPSLTLLQFHFCPIAYSLSDLRSVPFGTEVPTLFPNRSLIITSLPSDYEISINDVMIKGSPIFDDGVLVILGIDKFFDLNFKIGAPVAGSPSDGPRPSSNLECPVSYWDLYPFSEASESLRSRGYSIMASFLDLQLMQFDVEHTQFTVFAPMDEAMQGHIGNSTEWASVFLRHIVPCKLPMADLSRLDDGTLLRSFLGGFLINVTHSGDNLLLNDVPVVLSNMYQSDHVVVHGLGAILLTPEKQQEEELGNSPEYGVVAEEVILDEF
ncbi:hypothetical protein Nepgr_022160 [Nepenthes gracilis]|uniref:FAS1 domain-containing protein n=1 Tax=Nepenthes gracilis TaxID=150966 RepID=A0AAD3T085_NEPGR|nr:hypothetical protein Nepgr_022160 [Nepenthes gracilis]